MRHLRLLLLLTVMLSFHAAQGFGSENPGDSSVPEPPTLGFYFGATCSHFAGESSAPWDSRYGPDMGAYADFGMTDLLGLQLELAYLSKGGRIEEQFYPSSGVLRPSADIRLGYVQFAVLARLSQPRSRFKDERNFQPKLLGGFAISSLAETTSRGLAEEEVPHFRDTELSLVFGGGFDHRIWGRQAVTLDFRFDLGLSDIYADWSSNTARFLVGLTL